MKKSWFYPIIAIINDFYMSSFILGAIVAYSVSVTQKPMPIILAFVILFVSLVAAIIYHAWGAKRVPFLTPGEYIVGRVINSKIKIWTNPFGRNRWAFFLITIFTLVLAGNVWDGLSEGHIYTWSEVHLRVVLLGLLSYGYASMGTGRLQSVMYPMCFLLLWAYRTMSDAIVYLEIQRQLYFIAYGLIGLALLNAFIALTYHLIRVPNSLKNQTN